MRVLLVSANREHIPDPVFPLGLGYVAAAAIEAGHEVDVADLCFERRPVRALRRIVQRSAPEVVGLSLRNVDNAAYPLTVNYLAGHREVVDTVRRYTDAPVVLGGSAYSILPGEYLEALDGDWGIAGEGETAFVSLLGALERGGDPGGLPGVFTGPRRTGAGTGPPASAPVPGGLPRVARPARERFDYARYVRRGGTGNIQTKRGCVFRCSYCTYPLLEGNRFRARPAQDVVDEIEELIGRYGNHPLFFVDSILNFPRDHVESLCEEILRRGLELRWTCYATPVKLGREQAGMMARAGCEGVELGSDSVDSAQLQRLGKSFDAGVVRAANEHCLQAGLKVCHTILFGAPGETPESVRNTCRTLREMRPTAVVAMTGVRVYPGTALARQLAEAGHVEPGEIGLEPYFYVEPAVSGFLPGHLREQAGETGNWVLPGLEPPLLPASQRMIRALGVSGPLWKLLESPRLRHASRRKFQRPGTSWGIPNPWRTKP